MRGALDLHYPCPEVRSVNPRHSSRLAPQLNQVSLPQNPDRHDSPFGPMSSSVRKPSGPAAMLVGIPKGKCCWEDLSDFSGFLLYGYLIRILEAKRRPRWWTHNAKLHFLFVGAVTAHGIQLPTDGVQTNPHGIAGCPPS